MAPFSLLAPAGLWLLALIAPLIVLYILKVRRRKLVVSSTWLWESSKKDLLARSPFKKLLAQLSLLLQILALVLLALALARPATLGSQTPGGHLAIVIDVSASMGASSTDGRSSLDLAKQAARELVLALPPGSQAMVIEAGREPRTASPLDRDPRRIAASIDRLTALDVEGDLGAAVAVAIDRMQAYDDGRVVVVSDGFLASAPSLQGAALPVELVRVGAEIDNVAIIRADVRVGRDPARGEDEVQAFLLLANFGRSPRELFVTVRRDQTSDVLDSRRLMIAPAERAPVVLTFPLLPADHRAALVFDLSPHDGMPVDDVAYGRIPPGARLPVMLAAPKADPASPWLERALVSDPSVQLGRMSLADLEASLDVDPGALIVVEGACPSDDLPGGDVLIVHPPPGSCWGVKVGPAVAHPVPTSWETSDARMRFLTFDGVTIASASLLSPPSASMALVRASQGVLLADASSSSRTVTIVGFEPGESDWPLKASFVLFMRNVAELARTHRSAGVVSAATSGEPLRVTLPARASDVVVKDPSGARIEASTRGTLVIAPAVDHTGLYRVSYGGPRPGVEIVPVNLSSAAESDLRSRTDLGSSAGVTVSAAEVTTARYRDLAWIFALAALVVLLLEVWHFTRRPRAAPPGTVALPRAPDRRGP